jgi:quercetin dioxygenase-like cupin family protein
MKTANIYNDLIFEDHKPLIKVLFETSFTKEIIIAMKKGTVMKEHKTSFPIVVEVVSGVINFRVENKVLLLNKGSLIALEAHMPYDLKGLEDSVVRPTLTKNDAADRVKNAVESECLFK